MNDTTQDPVPYTLLEAVRRVDAARKALAAARAFLRTVHADGAEQPTPAARFGASLIVRDNMKLASEAVEAARMLQVSYMVERWLRFVGIIECVDGDDSCTALPVRVEARTQEEAQDKLQALLKDTVRLALLFPSMGIPEKLSPESCYLVGEDAPLI